MDRYQYLNNAFANKLHCLEEWIYGVFSIIREGEEEYLKDPYPYRIVQTPTGFYFVDPANDGKLSKISDSKPGLPLFRFLDPYIATPEHHMNVFSPIETTVGNALFNQVVLIECFRAAIPFMVGRIDQQIGKLEKAIAAKLQDTPATQDERLPNGIYVDDLDNCYASLDYLSSFSQLCTYSATPKNVLPPANIKEFKRNLLLKYKGKLGDPVELVRFQEEFKAFDREWLKDDPTSGRFVSGKIANIARVKMYLGLGADLTFEEKAEIEPILASLDEGVPIDAENFAIAMNAARFGSYGRSKNTMFGGMSLKMMTRALSAIKFVKGDCGTTDGLPEMFTESNIALFEGEYLLSAKGWITIEKAMFPAMIGKRGKVRSPMYCKSPGFTFCECCMGKNMSAKPDGAAIEGSEMTGIILYAFMGLFHGKPLLVGNYNTRDSFY